MPQQFQRNKDAVPMKIAQKAYGAIRLAFIVRLNNNKAAQDDNYTAGL